MDATDAFMDEDTNEGLEKTAPRQPSRQITVQEKRKLTLERVNGCGDKLDAKELETKAEENDEMTEAIDAKEESNKVDKKKSSVCP